jgi:type IV pilus assembly protein PilB
MGESLGSEFLESKKITEEQLAAAKKMQSETGGDLNRILVKLGHLTEQDLLESTAKREGLEVATSEDLKPDTEIVAKLPRELLEKNSLLPIGHTVSHLKLAVADPGNLPAIEEIRFRSGLEVDLVLASPKEIHKALSALFPAVGAQASHRGGTRRARPKMDAREVARQVGKLPAAADAAKAVADINASPAKLIRALGALLIEKHVISASELSEWVHRLE